MKYIILILLSTPIYLFSSHQSNAMNTQLQKHLNDELNDQEIAKELANIVCSTILAWKPPTIPTSQVNSIIAFAFGNHILPSGNRLPGPVNQALADVAVQLHQETNAHVYAQWEIAEAIGDRILAEKITVIYPTLDVQANVVYLSTAGVISAMIKEAGSPQKLGNIAVVAFNDHLYRCIQLCNAAGLNAYAPEQYNMPHEYDQNSGQPWTRDRLTYLIIDMRARITSYLERQ